MTAAHTRRRSAAIITAALVLALAAIAAPASARVFDLNAQGSIVPPSASSTPLRTHPSASPTVDPCSEVCAGRYGSPRGISWQQDEKVAALASPRPRRTAPSAPGPIAAVSPCPRVGRCVSPTSGRAHDASVDSVRLTSASSQGFRWDDAGIGAAGMLVLLSAGGMAAIVSRRGSNHAAIS
jgi:hypothetical protein